MNDDELRRRLEGIDPLSGGPGIDPITSPAARQLLENIMTTPIHPDTRPTTSDAPPAPPFRGAETAMPDRNRRRLAWLGAAAAVIATVAVGAALVNNDDGGSSTAGPGGEPATVLELSAGDLDPAMMSCLPISAEHVAQVPLAFRATVDAVDGDIVTMTVDEWYTGGDADAVTLTAPLGMEALIGGIDFSVGETVLITAVDGVVNYCGMSGPATPELQAIFDAAFPA